MASQSRLTSELAQEAHETMLIAVQPLQREYEMHVTESGGCLAGVRLQNQDTFISLTWSPKEGLEYSIGPLVDGLVPPADIFYRPGQSPHAYEIAWFAKLAGVQRNADIRGKIDGFAESLRTGVELVMKIAGAFLAGDWSRREKLDELIEQNYRDRT